MSLSIHQNVNLAPYTTYKIGGPARYFCDANNEEEIIEALAWARRSSIQYFVLGGGSNILVSDRGFDGLVIRIQNSRFQIQDSVVEAGAGLDLPILVDTAIDNGLQGFEWASGIPGTFGGAIRGNAGAFGGEIKDIITSVRFIDKKGFIRIFDNKSCKFSYRNSIFKQNPGGIIISATVELKRGDRDALKKASEDIKVFRASRHPLEYGSCGSVFKAVSLASIHPTHFERYPRFKSLIKNDPFPVIPMACFIDEADLKGFKIGGAMVSGKHPNFFVNYSNATAEDVIMLISITKQRILDIFKVFPEEEVQYVGF